MVNIFGTKHCESHYTITTAVTVAVIFIIHPRSKNKSKIFYFMGFISLTLSFIPKFISKIWGLSDFAKSIKYTSVVKQPERL